MLSPNLYSTVMLKFNNSTKVQQVHSSMYDVSKVLTICPDSLSIALSLTKAPTSFPIAPTHAIACAVALLLRTAPSARPPAHVTGKPVRIRPYPSSDPLLLRRGVVIPIVEPLKKKYPATLPRIRLVRTMNEHRKGLEDTQRVANNKTLNT